MAIDRPHRCRKSRARPTGVEIPVGAAARELLAAVPPSAPPVAGLVLPARRTADPRERDELGGTTVPAAAAAALALRRGTGKALPRAVGVPMGEAFGADLSAVRVHVDGEADQLARSMQAKAFTLGQDLYFTRGAYSPATVAGQTLLAHEIAHVVQGWTTEPGAASGAAATIGRAADPAEAAADSMADTALRRLRRQAVAEWCAPPVVRDADTGPAEVRRSPRSAVIRRVFVFTSGWNEYGFLPDQVSEAIEASRVFPDLSARADRDRRALSDLGRQPLGQEELAGINAFFTKWDGAIISEHDRETVVKEALSQIKRLKVLAAGYAEQRLAAEKAEADAAATKDAEVKKPAKKPMKQSRRVPKLSKAESKMARDDAKDQESAAREQAAKDRQEKDDKEQAERERKRAERKAAAEKRAAERAAAQKAAAEAAAAQQAAAEQAEKNRIAAEQAAAEQAEAERIAAERAEAARIAEQKAAAEAADRIAAERAEAARIAEQKAAAEAAAAAKAQQREVARAEILGKFDEQSPARMIAIETRLDSLLGDEAVDLVVLRRVFGFSPYPPSDTLSLCEKYRTPEALSELSRMMRQKTKDIDPSCVRHIELMMLYRTDAHLMQPPQLAAMRAEAHLEMETEAVTLETSGPPTDFGRRSTNEHWRANEANDAKTGFLTIKFHNPPRVSRDIHTHWNQKGNGLITSMHVVDWSLTRSDLSAANGIEFHAYPEVFGRLIAEVVKLHNDEFACPESAPGKRERFFV